MICKRMALYGLFATLLIMLGFSPPLATDPLWTSNGPFGGRIYSLAIDPMYPSTIYVGTGGGGIFKSEDGGESWFEASNGLTDKTVRGIAVDPTDPSRVYCATDAGIFKSKNGGRDWYRISAGGGSRVLRIDSSDPLVIYAGGVNRSTDGGRTWSAILNPQRGLTGYAVFDLEVDPIDPSNIYVATGGGVYMSRDGGRSWSYALGDLAVRSLGVDPFNPARIYSGTSKGRLFKTEDSGETWDELSVPWKDTAISSLLVDPSDPSIVYAGTERMGLFKSSDAGTSWTNMTEAMEDLEVSVLALDPADPSRIYMGTWETGVFRSDDRGTTWSEIDTGLRSMRIHSLVADPSLPDALYAASRKAIYRSFDGGRNWTRSSFRRYFSSLVIRPGEPYYLYAASAYVKGGGIFWSEDRGATWYKVDRNLSDSGAYPLCLTTTPTAPSALYAGTTDGVYLSEDGGTTWWAIGLQDRKIKGVQSLTVHPDTPSRIYATIPIEGIYVTEDGGDTWRKVDNGLPGRRPSDIPGEVPLEEIMFRSAVVLHPYDPSMIYVLSDLGIFRSEDEGSTWSDISPGLSDRDVTSLVVDPSDSSTIYVAVANAGVFRSRDRGESWTKIDEGLGDASVTSLVIDPHRGDRLHAATSRGVFSLTLTDLEEDTEPQPEAGEEKGIIVPCGLEGKVVWSITIDPTDPDILYASVPDGLYRTQDGGGVWRKISRGLREDGPIGPVAVDPRDSEVLYVAAREQRHPYRGRNGIFKSTDGGESWTLIKGGLGVDDVSFILLDPTDPDVVYVSSKKVILKSFDGGKTWKDITNGLAGTGSVYGQYHIPIVRATSDVLYAGTDGGVFKSIDGGSTWERLNVYGVRVRVRALAVDPVDPDILYVGTEFGEVSKPMAGHSINIPGLYKSLDGGESWRPICVDGVPGPNVWKIWIDPTDPQALYVWEDGNPVRSLDGGETWEKFDPFDSGKEASRRMTRALDKNWGRPSTLYIGTRSGLFKYVVEASAYIERSELDEDSDIPLRFRLEQNYPNPFNAETTIRYVLPEPRHIRLVIYDALGRRVRTLADKEQASGQYSVLWEGRDDKGEAVSTGVYFYRLEAGGKYRKVKRMMLLR